MTLRQILEAFAVRVASFHQEFVGFTGTISGRVDGVESGLSTTNANLGGTHALAQEAASAANTANIGLNTLDAIAVKSVDFRSMIKVTQAQYNTLLANGTLNPTAMYVIQG